MVLVLFASTPFIQRGPHANEGSSLLRSPLVQPALWAQLKDYNRPDFHPDDSDTDALLDEWRERLFGPSGTHNDKLVGAGRVA